MTMTSGNYNMARKLNTRQAAERKKKREIRVCRYRQKAGVKSEGSA